MLERTDRGACVFFEQSSHLCVVHRDAGEQELPATCRHFPRLSVRDARGTFVTLSHFCPTAASMLFREDVQLEIIESPTAFPLADYDGLTVTPDDLPPLLSPSMLMDAPGYAAWERHMVDRCSADESPESVVATLASDAAQLKTWRPGSEPLDQHVRRLTPAFIRGEAPASLGSSFRLREDVVTAIPDDLKPMSDEFDLESAYGTYVRPLWNTFQRPINRYLAAKAFASWTAYQGQGIATIVRGLEAALALVRIESSRQSRNARRDLDPALLLEAFRSADFMLNHLAVGDDLAAVWSRVESLGDL